MQSICSQYAVNMQSICSQYAVNMQSICSQYAVNMQSIRSQYIGTLFEYNIMPINNVYPIYNRIRKSGVLR